MKIAVIGFGYWGPNLVRNFNFLPDCKVKWIVDLRKERLILAQRLYPESLVTDDAEKVWNDPEVEAVIIAAPVPLHFEFGQKALAAGKHVLLEKPMTRTVSESLELMEIAASKGSVLMTDHTFLYTGAVRKIKQLVASGELGDLLYYDATRINLGLFHDGANVLWDLAPHDLSVLLYLQPQKPVSLVATGISHTPNGVENLAYLTLFYNQPFMAHITVSWASPVKIRSLLLGASKKMVVYNDVEPTEKVKVYDTGFRVRNDVDRQKLLVDYRTGDIQVPKIDTSEALKGMAEDFYYSIKTGTQPVSDSASGLAVVKILEAAETSIKHHGKEIMLNW